MAHNKVVLRSAAAWVRDLRPRSGEWLGRLHGHIGLAVNVEVMRGILVERSEGSNSCSRFITVSPSSPGHARARTVLSRSRKDPEHKAHRSKNTHKQTAARECEHMIAEHALKRHTQHTHSPIHAHAHKHAHAHAHAHAHTHTRARTHTHTLARARARVLSPSSLLSIFSEAPPFLRKKRY